MKKSLSPRGRWAARATRSLAALALPLLAALISPVAAPAQALAIQLGNNAMCAVASKPPLQPLICGATRFLTAGTPVTPATSLRCEVISARARARLDITGLEDGVSADLLVDGTSPTQTQERSLITDDSQPCGSGFPLQLWIDPPPCQFDLVIDAANTGGGSTVNSLDGTTLAIRDSAASLLFQWDSTKAGQRGMAPHTVSLPLSARAEPVTTEGHCHATITDRRAYLVEESGQHLHEAVVRLGGDDEQRLTLGIVDPVVGGGGHGQTFPRDVGLRQLALAVVGAHVAVDVEEAHGNGVGPFVTRYSPRAGHRCETPGLLVGSAFVRSTFAVQDNREGSLQVFHEQLPARSR